MKNMKNVKTVNIRFIKELGKNSFNKIFPFHERHLVLALLVLLCFASGLITLMWLTQERINGFVVNSTAKRTYRAVIPSSFTDEEATSNFRDLATQGIEGVVVYKPIEKNKVRKDIEFLTPENYQKLSFPERFSSLLGSLPDNDLIEVFNASKKVISNILEMETDEIKEPQQLSSLAWAQLEELDIPRSRQNIIFQLISDILVPESSMDNEMTEELKSMVRNRVEPVVRILSPGDVIVKKGDKVTPEIASALKDQGYPERSFPLKQLLLILAAVILWISWFSKIINDEAVNFKGKNGWLYSSCLIGIGWVVLYISDLFKTPGSGLVAFSGLAYLTLPRRIAFHLVLGGSLIGALLIEGFAAGVIVVTGLMGYTAALAGYYIVTHADSRSLLWWKLFTCGIIISLIGLASRWLIGMTISFSYILNYLLANTIWSVLILVLLPLLENVFDVLSPLRLIELAQPSHALLKKLQVEAPGTYHHSLMVSTLAEAASERLGLDTALVKAGCYYHDIGKLKRPHYYVENQVSLDNIHDSISPSLSALSIIAHVREGTEIAREYKLPRRVIDFISEHHGKTCLSYFYRKAKKQGDEGITREQFCYPGPLPDSKETGLLMIVDSVEAAVRGDIENIHSRKDIEKIIDGVIDNKIGEHQLDNVDFTLKEFKVIKEALLSTLQSMYHTRRIQELEEQKNQ